MSSASRHNAPRAWILTRTGEPEVRIWGLTPEERLERSLRTAGCARVDSLASGDALRDEGSGTAVVIRGDLIFAPQVVAGLAATPGTLLVAAIDGAGSRAVPVAAHVETARAGEIQQLLRAGTTPDATDPGLRTVEPDELAPAYNASLRKVLPSYVLGVTPGDVPAIEKMLFGAAYKNITDLVTKWAWPVPAAAVTRWLAERRVHPNTITAVSWILAIATTLLFAEGHFGLGLASGWLMTFLDTVDGKLARVTLQSSRVGHVLDHGLDLIHPPIWYFAWGYGVTGGLDAATAVVIAGYLAGRLMEGAFLLAFDMEIHCWRPIDTLFRTITARRNPNMILLTVCALAGASSLGMTMVAVWTVASIGFHIVRLSQAFAVKLRGGPIVPWDEAFSGGDRPTPTNGNATESAG